LSDFNVQFNFVTYMYYINLAALHYSFGDGAGFAVVLLYYF